jgi:hypothetical protein
MCFPTFYTTNTPRLKAFELKYLKTMMFPFFIMNIKFTRKYSLFLDAYLDLRKVKIDVFNERIYNVKTSLLVVITCTNRK